MYGVNCNKAENIIYEEHYRKTISFFDSKQKELIYGSIFLCTISGILYLFFHTSICGYDSEIEDNLFLSFGPIVFLLMATPLYKIEDKRLDKRVVTYAYMLLFWNYICEIVIEMYCILVKDISMIGVAVIYIPMFVALVYILFRWKNYYRNPLKKAKLKFEHF